MCYCTVYRINPIEKMWTGRQSPIGQAIRGALCNPSVLSFASRESPTHRWNGYNGCEKIQVSDWTKPIKRQCVFNFDIVENSKNKERKENSPRALVGHTTAVVVGIL